MQRLNKFDKIEIEWADACSSTDRAWWSWIQYKNWIGITSYYKVIGYFIEYTKDCIVVCNGFSHFLDGEVNQISDITAIPKGCIKKVKRL